ARRVSCGERGRVRACIFGAAVLDRQAAYASGPPPLSPSFRSNEACDRALGSSLLCETRSPRRHSHWSLYGRAQPRIEPVNPSRTARRTPAASLDHLVGASKQRRWHLDAEGLRGPEVDDKLELGGAVNRYVGGFGAFEDSAGIGADPSIGIGHAVAVAE